MILWVKALNIGGLQLKLRNEFVVQHCAVAALLFCPRICLRNPRKIFCSCLRVGSLQLWSLAFSVLGDAGCFDWQSMVEQCCILNCFWTCFVNCFWRVCSRCLASCWIAPFQPMNLLLIHQSSPPTPTHLVNSLRAIDGQIPWLSLSSLSYWKKEGEQSLS